MPSRALILAAALCAVAPTPMVADTSFESLTPTERAILRAEIRALLLFDPEIVQNALTPPPNLYADDIADDLSLIRAHETALFGENAAGFGPKAAAVTLAVFIAPDCPDCDATLADLRALADTMSLRITLHDISGETARALLLDVAPSYVLPKMMIRGAMPAALLARYIDKSTR